MKKFITTSLFVLFLAFGQVFGSGPETPAQRQQILAAAAVEMGIPCAELVAEDEQGNVSVEYVSTDIATGASIYRVTDGGGVTVCIEEVI